MFRFCASSTALASKAPEASSIAATAQTNGHVRVIVLLNAPNIANQARPDTATFAAARAQVAGLQDTVLANHFGDATNLRPGRGFTRRHTRFAITPGFVIDVDAAEFEALASDPLVKTINIDQARPPTLLQSLPLIGQPTAYSNGATGAGWAVAVLDTGVQSNHEFLSGKVVAEACFSNAAGAGGGISLCPNGQNSQTGTGAADSTTANCFSGGNDICWHGTHVAGIAAGLNTNPQSGRPANGVARDGKIFAVQVFTRYNDTTNCSPSNPPCLLSWDSDQVSALDYVYQHLTPVTGVNVASINMSLSWGPNTSTACESDFQKTAIDNLRAAGVLTAIAAGNDGSKTLISHPACISSAVAVGSTTKGDVVSSFSNMATIVALLAPGGFGGGSCTFGGNNPNILSSGASATTNTYFCAAGTSMATPHVAGAIAAARTACPSATASAILSAFQSSGLAITDTRSGAPGTITKPRIQLDAALAALNCGPGSLAVTPSTDIASSGAAGGPFSPASFNYTLSASTGSVNYSISGVPTWLTPSSTSGTVTTAGTSVSFTVNGNANGLGAGTYTATITFTNTTNGAGNQTRSATLTVNAVPPVLQVSPVSDIASSGNAGGPFSPVTFLYQLSASTASTDYLISGMPSWLTVSSSSGTLTTASTNIKFTINTGAYALSPGVYNATISFTNTTNGQGNQTRNVSLTVNSGGGSSSATPSWVSGAGNDANPCTRTAPCQTYAGAIAKTATGGEINCLDAAGYGIVTINKSISIVCGYAENGVLAASVNGIIIDAPAGSKVTLKGQDIDCAGTEINGIEMIGVGVTLHVHKSQIRNCRGAGGNGILITPSSGAASLFVTDSTITDNGAAVNNAGLLVRPTGGASASVSINRDRFEGNTNGIFADGSGGGGASSVSVSNSVLSHSRFNGLAIASLSGAFLATINKSTISFNAGVGAAVANPSATLRIGKSTIVGNATGVSNANGTLQTFKNNFIASNASNGMPITAFPGPGGQPLQ